MTLKAQKELNLTLYMKSSPPKSKNVTNLALLPLNKLDYLFILF